MRVRTLLQPLQVAALLSTAAIPGHARAADDVERSVHLRYGQPNGFQEVRHNADGSISIISISPNVQGLFEFVAGERDHKRTLTLRDSQLEDVFAEQ